MKQAESDALCRREHEADGGEVTAVTLTAGSLCELSADVLGRPGVKVSVPAGTRLPVVAGARVSHCRHPVTRLAVPVSLGEADTATVRHGPGGTLTRTVAIA